MASRRHREVFFAHNGAGPWACHFCGEDVEFDAVQVHHLDEDHGNNDPSNLGASHRGCHTKHHAVWRFGGCRPGVPKSPETREKIRASITATLRAKREVTQIG